MSVYIYAVGCRYNAIQYNMILYTVYQWLRQNIKKILYSEKTPHTPPVYFVRVWEKIERVKTAPHCNFWLYIWSSQRRKIGQYDDVSNQC